MIRRPALWLAAGLAVLAASPLQAGSAHDEAIRSAFQEVLGRDPAPAEISTYRARMMDAGWSRRQVVRALHRSDEYIVPAIGRVFRETLGREPNEEEIELYHRRVKERGWTYAQIRRALRRTDEGRRR